MRQPVKRTRYPFILLIVGILAYIITDTSFSYLVSNGAYVSGSVIDAGWVIAFILVGLAGILYGNRANVESLEVLQRRPKHAISSFIPLLWVGTSVFMLVWGYYNLPPSNFATVQLKFIIFMILVLIRYGLSILEKKGFFRGTLRS